MDDSKYRKHFLRRTLLFLFVGVAVVLLILTIDYVRYVFALI